MWWLDYQGDDESESVAFDAQREARIVWLAFSQYAAVLATSLAIEANGGHSTRFARGAGA